MNKITDPAALARIADIDLANELDAHADGFRRRYENAKQKVAQRIADGYLVSASEMSELIQAQEAASIASVLDTLSGELRDESSNVERVRHYIMSKAMSDSRRGSGIERMQRDAAADLWLFVARERFWKTR